MQEFAVRLKAYMEREKLSQVAMAKRAGVSQSAVSRALSGMPLRLGPAKAKLCKYAGMQDGELDGSARVAAAFSRIWDKSPEHADAVVAVIAALGSFTKKKP